MVARPYRWLHAKKRLGQNFLCDDAVARRIVSFVAGDAAASLSVVEVGGGRGALTKHLLALDRELTVVEFDATCVEFLLHTYAGLRERLVQADFLRLDLQQLCGGRQFVLIGNYPYNISSQIVIKVLANKALIPICGGMFQDEVALRLAASEGGRTRGVLSVLLQAWYNVEYLFSVPPTAFIPQPKVSGGVVRFCRNSRETLGCDEELFVRIVKTTFNQRRKMLRHTLRPLLAVADCEESRAFLSRGDLCRRPEELSVDDFIGLTRNVSRLNAVV